MAEQITKSGLTLVVYEPDPKYFVMAAGAIDDAVLSGLSLTSERFTDPSDALDVLDELHTAASPNGLLVARGI